jgi:hypothetical protein
MIALTDLQAYIRRRPIGHLKAAAAGFHAIGVNRPQPKPLIQGNAA